jgi:hypothetical protein
MADIVPVTYTKEPPRGIPIMIDPTRINTDQPAVYVSLKANRFYYRTADELIRDLPTQVSRDTTLIQENRPVITNAATAVSEKPPSRFSSLFTRRAPRPDAAPRPGSVANAVRSNATRRVNRPSGPSILNRFRGLRTTPPIRKGSVANTMRKNNAGAATKTPSRFSTYPASALSGTRKLGSSIAKGVSATGRVASSAFRGKQGYTRVNNNSNATPVPDVNPFKNPLPAEANNLSENNPFKNPRTKPVPLPTATKPGLLNKIKSGAKGVGSALGATVGAIAGRPGLF